MLVLGSAFRRSELRLNESSWSSGHRLACLCVYILDITANHGSVHREISLRSSCPFIALDQWKKAKDTFVPLILCYRSQTYLKMLQTASNTTPNDYENVSASRSWT